jgi:hypothetical protein
MYWMEEINFFGEADRVSPPDITLEIDPIAKKIFGQKRCSTRKFFRKYNT